MMLSDTIPADCPKCGAPGTFIYKKYCPSACHEFPGVKLNDPEHMHHRCRECDYTVGTACLDNGGWKEEQVEFAPAIRPLRR